MYEGVRMRVRTEEGDTDDFLIEVELHQFSTLNLFLLALVIDEVMNYIQ